MDRKRNSPEKSGNRIPYYETTQDPRLYTSCTKSISTSISSYSYYIPPKWRVNPNHIDKVAECMRKYDLPRTAEILNGHFDPLLMEYQEHDSETRKFIISEAVKRLSEEEREGLLEKVLTNPQMFEDDTIISELRDGIISGVINAKLLEEGYVELELKPQQYGRLEFNVPPERKLDIDLKGAYPKIFVKNEGEVYLRGAENTELNVLSNDGNIEIEGETKEIDLDCGTGTVRVSGRVGHVKQQAQVLVAYEIGRLDQRQLNCKDTPICVAKIIEEVHLFNNKNNPGKVFAYKIDNISGVNGKIVTGNESNIGEMIRVEVWKGWEKIR